MRTLPFISLPNALRQRLGQLRSALACWLRRFSLRQVPWEALGELALILGWALFVGRNLLDLRPDIAPIGLHFGEVLPHFVWRLLPRCGACMLWNGSANGGSPALADLHGNVLHPLLALAVLIWGGLNGTKMALVGALAMAGLAQWWLAKVLKLGPLARLWSGMLAVAGGHLAGRMEDGVFPLVFATSAVSLVIAPALDLALAPRRRATITFGVVLALAVLAGQGYLLLGLALGLMPPLVLYLFDDKLRLRPVWKEFALGLGLAALLAGIFWVPVAHFYPQFVKDADPAFRSTQPLEYAPLNLVIRDPAFFATNALQKQPFPFLYVNYIGWAPVILALFGLRLAPRSASRTVLYLVLAIGCVLLVGTAVPFRLAGLIAPQLAGEVRNSVVILSLLVPPILALAAWGLDGLMRLHWPRLTLAGSAAGDSTFALSLSLSWLLIIPLVFSLKAAHDFGHAWLRQTQIAPTDQEVVAALVPEETQWISPPYGEHFWMPFLYERDLKVSPFIRPWRWRGRELPKPFREATRAQVDDSSPDLSRRIGGIALLSHPANQYAAFATATASLPAHARALGGNIDVEIDAPEPGQLVVYENNWSGWHATVDGRPVALERAPWLVVPVPAGAHRVSFRYRPWDVALGAALTLVGLVLVVYLSIRGDPKGTKAQRREGALEDQCP